MITITTKKKTQKGITHTEKHKQTNKQTTAKINTNSMLHIHKNNNILILIAITRVDPILQILQFIGLAATSEP